VTFEAYYKNNCDFTQDSNIIAIFTEYYWDRLVDGEIFWGLSAFDSIRCVKKYIFSQDVMSMPLMKKFLTVSTEKFEICHSL
jgi:hypothetical protein